MRLAIAAALAVTLANTAIAANVFHERLASLPETERNKFLAMTIQQERCGRVTYSFYQGSDKSGAAFWNVRCTNGMSYSVAIYPDRTGSTKVLECSVLKALANVDCFVPFTAMDRR